MFFPKSIPPLSLRFTRYAVFAPVDQRQSYYIAVDQTPSTQRELLERTRLAFEEEDPRIITTLEAEPAEGEGEPLSEVLGVGCCIAYHTTRRQINVVLVLQM